MKTGVLIAAAALSLTTSLALAQDRGAAQDRGFYLGAGVGQSRTNIDSGDVDAAAVASGFASSSTSADDNDTGWKLFAGYQFNRHFALELGYTDLGKITTSTTTTGPAADIGGEFKAHAWSLDAVGIAPLNESISLFGKLGVTRWDADARVAVVSGGAAGSASASDDGTGWKWGLGAQYNITKNVGARLEWESFRKVGDEDTTGQGNIHFISLGVGFKF